MCNIAVDLVFEKKIDWDSVKMKNTELVDGNERNNYTSQSMFFSKNFEY